MPAKFWRNPFKWLGEKLAPRKPPTPPPQPKPKQPEPSLALKRRRTIRHIIANTPMADRAAVTHHVQYMDEDELDDTLTMTMAEIQAQAKYPGDRLADRLGNQVPLNPWWYHPWT